MAITLHEDDLPAGFEPGPAIAVDTETMGLRPARDRLCLVQLSTGDGNALLLQVRSGRPAPARLAAVLADPAVLKIFHFARFDIATLHNALGVMTGPVYCTKIASKLARTYTDRHGLKDLCRELLRLELSKEQQSSDWGADMLSQEQQTYAATDVLYLHKLRDKLDMMLAREGRTALAEACFRFLPTRALLDLGGFEDLDILAH